MEDRFLINSLLYKNSTGARSENIKWYKTSLFLSNEPYNVNILYGVFN